jgi:hypothetical protein
MDPPSTPDTSDIPHKHEFMKLSFDYDDILAKEQELILQSVQIRQYLHSSRLQVQDSEEDLIDIQVRLNSYQHLKRIME